MMKRRLIYVAVLLSFASVALGGEEPRGLIWKAVRGEAEVFLAGSVHILDSGSPGLPPSYLRAADDAAVIFFETDMQAAQSPDVQRNLRRMASFPPDTRLSSHIDKALVRRLQDHIRGSGITLDTLQPYRPWFVALTLTIQSFRDHGMNPEQGVDMQLLERARDRDVDIRFFETAVEQFRLFADMSDDLSEAFLAKTLEDIEQFDDLVGGMLDLWRAGDAETLHAYMLEQFDGYEDVYRTWVIDRNHAWLPAILNAAEESRSVLVVAGAAHHTGPEGLPALLTAEGYTVERIPYP